eukprot:2314544-Prymnesium_polylepis.1
MANGVAWRTMKAREEGRPRRAEWAKRAGRDAQGATRAVNAPHACATPTRHAHATRASTTLRA